MASDKWCPKDIGIRQWQILMADIKWCIRSRVANMDVEAGNRSGLFSMEAGAWKYL